MKFATGMLRLNRPSSMQRTLSGEQVEAFYHDEFVEDQARDFVELVGRDSSGAYVLDIGGGCGFFAKRLAEITGCRITVIDTDPVSIEACRRAGIEAIKGDALDPGVRQNADVVTFNMILHHLIGSSERATESLQRDALALWREHARAIFVNEYIYESFIKNLSAKLIFLITKSRVLSAIGRTVARFIPAFKANTFGVGVRFRSRDEWQHLFASAGYEVKSSVLGAREKVVFPLRLLLIRDVRRDSFLLAPKRIHD